MKALKADFPPSPRTMDQEDVPVYPVFLKKVISFITRDLAEGVKESRAQQGDERKYTMKPQFCAPETHCPSIGKQAVASLHLLSCILPPLFPWCHHLPT